ncbi:MAG: Txe/YoeB family addiction module toxin [Coriobacteriales bacterium]|jgi:toxin YoeB|nr:Txe/YoeB family addiction module toxin [Coriobacteriales bacterium]
MSFAVKFDTEAWNDYLDWQNQDKKTLRKINSLIKDAAATPGSGLGKPEPLKNDLAGCWSRRINEKDRLVYRINDDMLEILQCKGHYGDR